MLVIQATSGAWSGINMFGAPSTTRVLLAGAPGPSFLVLLLPLTPYPLFVDDVCQLWQLSSCCSFLSFCCVCDLEMEHERGA